MPHQRACHAECRHVGERGDLVDSTRTLSPEAARPLRGEHWLESIGPGLVRAIDEVGQERALVVHRLGSRAAS